MLFLKTAIVLELFTVRTLDNTKRHDRSFIVHRLSFIAVNYRKSFTPFLPATVFFGPLRVRALVRVR